MPVRGASDNVSVTIQWVGDLLCAGPTSLAVQGKFGIYEAEQGNSVGMRSDKVHSPWSGTHFGSHHDSSFRSVCYLPGVDDPLSSLILLLHLSPLTQKLSFSKSFTSHQSCRVEWEFVAQ